MKLTRQFEEQPPATQTNTSEPAKKLTPQMASRAPALSGAIGMIIQQIQSSKVSPLHMQQDILYLQSVIGNRAVVQLLSQLQPQKPKETPAASSVHTIAAAGIQGKGKQLPHFAKIQASFGRFDLSLVRAYTGNQAAAASRAIGAEAYTVGNKIAFAYSNPSLHTAAHEAAHTIQQQAGVQLKDNIGKAGDSYEQHADAVANAVVQGQSAEHLLSTYTTTTLSAAENTQQAGSATQFRAMVVQRKLKVGGEDFSEDKILTSAIGKDEIPYLKFWMQDNKERNYNNVAELKAAIESFDSDEHSISLINDINSKQQELSTKILEQRVGKKNFEAGKLRIRRKKTVETIQLAEEVKSPYLDILSATQNLIHLYMADNELFINDKKNDKKDKKNAENYNQKLSEYSRKITSLSRDLKLPYAVAIQIYYPLLNILDKLTEEEALTARTFSALGRARDKNTARFDGSKLSVPFSGVIKNEKEIGNLILSDPTDCKHASKKSNGNYQIGEVKLGSDLNSAQSKLNSMRNEFSLLSTLLSPEYKIINTMEIIENKARVQLKPYTKIYYGPATSVERGSGQITAMSNTNAAGYALFYNLPNLGTDWEWLHIQAAGLSGPTISGNLLPGTADANTWMMPFENNLKKLANHATSTNQLKVTFAPKDKVEKTVFFAGKTFKSNHAYKQIKIEWDIDKGKTKTNKDHDGQHGEVIFDIIEGRIVTKDDIRALEDYLKKLSVQFA